MYIPIALSLKFVHQLAANTPQFVLSQHGASAVPYSLPMGSQDTAERANAVEIKREAFTYGQPLFGDTSYWPSGSLGNATVQLHGAQFEQDAASVVAGVGADKSLALSAIKASGGLNQLSDYENLYKGQWKTSMPEGLDSGILANYTQDLLFSMERLSVNPYTIKRLNPNTDSLAFRVELASTVTGATLDSLFASGRLFYSDHRDQATLEKIDGRHAAACDAYFYIHPATGDFLPLAIRTDNALIYTPADDDNDWLLAKMMYNLNDVWHSAWYHLAATHLVLQIVYEAAFRTLSENHPIMALLDRLTPALFSYGTVAVSTLFPNGGAIDKTFAFTGASASSFSSKLYVESAGSFQGNYFEEDLKARGLLNCSFGPQLKSFPFYEDAFPIKKSMQNFMATFVDSYYPTSATFEQDKELQAWVAEATPANIKDFPTKIDYGSLVEILTHFAFLNTVVHHTLNTNSLEDQMGALPIHPWSLSLPPPTSKGNISNIVPFLPNVTTSIEQLALAASFARNSFSNSQRDMTNMFANTTFLTRMNSKTALAAKRFGTEMMLLSEKVSTKKFDVHGLCQGMPFIWRSLDPKRSPYYLAV